MVMKNKLLTEEPMTATVLLSDNILFDCILPRIPVKSLIRFHCVSKSWCSAIKGEHDDHFLWKLHHKYSSSSSSSCLRKPRVVIDDVDFNIHIYDMINFMNHPVTDPLADVGISNLPTAYRIVSSCDGMLCLEAASLRLRIKIAGKDVRYCLFDLPSRNIRPIHIINKDIICPCPPPLRLLVREPTSRKYKLLLGRQNPYNNIFEAWILTLEAEPEDDQCRALSTVDCEWLHLFHIPFHEEPPRVFGAVFWVYAEYVPNNHRRERSRGVVSFDITKERFRKIAVPTDSKSSPNLYLAAGSETQGLNLFDFKTGPFRLEVWVLKHYDSETSADDVVWTKRCNLDIEFLPKVVLPVHYGVDSNVVAMFGEQVLFMAKRANYTDKHTSSLEVYNVRLNSLRHCEDIYSCSEYYCVEPCTCSILYRELDGFMGIQKCRLLAFFLFMAQVQNVSSEYNDTIFRGF